MEFFAIILDKSEVSHRYVGDVAAHGRYDCCDALWSTSLLIGREVLPMKRFTQARRELERR